MVARWLVNGGDNVLIGHPKLGYRASAQVWRGWQLAMVGIRADRGRDSFLLCPTLAPFGSINRP